MEKTHLTKAGLLSAAQRETSVVWYGLLLLERNQDRSCEVPFIQSLYQHH